MNRLVFIVDLNELVDGDFLPISMDFTRNYGPGVRVRHDAQPVPSPGDWVQVYNGDDDVMFFALVDRALPDGDLLVKVDWASRTSARIAREQAPVPQRGRMEFSSA